MLRLAAIAATLAFVCGCRAHAPARDLGPLGDEAEVYLYVQRFPQEAGRLAMSVGAAWVVRADGVEVPLNLEVSDLSGRDTTRQRLLAWGRVPPGAYAGFRIAIARATLATDGGRSDLLVPEEPTRVEGPFNVERGKAVVRHLVLSYGRSVEKRFGFEPSFMVFVPPVPIPENVGYCSNVSTSNLTLFDKVAREVVAVTAMDEAPVGVALDVRARRAYAALARADEIAVLDLATGVVLATIRLQPGDRPRELAFTSDGRTLLAVNQDSNTLAFVDPASFLEVRRVQVGQEPVSLAVDRAARRAYVLNSRSSDISVVDLAYGTVVATIATETEPVRAALNRAGTRLYVIHDASAYMTVFSLPDLALTSRIFVGFGASAIKVDPRSDLVYVARRDDPALQIYDPFSLIPVDVIRLPDAATYLAIDDLQNLLLALMPERRSIAFVDLTSKEVVSLVDVGLDAFAVSVAGERR